MLNVNDIMPQIFDNYIKFELFFQLVFEFEIHKTFTNQNEQ